MKPRASAPASTATRASPALVMPQILTRVTLSTRLAGLLACGSSAPSQLELPSALASPGFHSALASWLRHSARIATPAELAQLEQRAPSRLESSQRQLAHLGAYVGRPHQAFAHEHGVGARLHHAPDIGGGEDPALADGGVRARHAREQIDRGLETGLERLEVAVVHADHGRAQGQRALELGSRVDLDEGGEPDALGGMVQISQPRLF